MLTWLGWEYYVVDRSINQILHSVLKMSKTHQGSRQHKEGRLNTTHVQRTILWSFGKQVQFWLTVRQGRNGSLLDSMYFLTCHIYPILVSVQIQDSGNSRRTLVMEVNVGGALLDVAWSLFPAGPGEPTRPERPWSPGIPLGPGRPWAPGIPLFPLSPGGPRIPPKNTWNFTSGGSLRATPINLVDNSSVGWKKNPGQCIPKSK